METATAEAALWMLAAYDAQNPAALREVMAACARIYPNWKKFREEEYPWFRVAEQTYDNFVLAGSGQQTRAD